MSSANQTNICQPPKICTRKIIFRVFWSKVTIAYIFHHFHYFEPFRASFYIFPYNWPWTASLPAFKTLLNSAQLEKIRFLRTKQKFYSPEEILQFFEFLSKVANVYIFSPFSPISGPFVPFFWFFHIIGLELLIFLRSKRCLVPSNSKN